MAMAARPLDAGGLSRAFSPSSSERERKMKRNRVAEEEGFSPRRPPVGWRARSAIDCESVVNGDGSAATGRRRSKPGVLTLLLRTRKEDEAKSGGGGGGILTTPPAGGLARKIGNRLRSGCEWRWQRGHWTPAV